MVWFTAIDTCVCKGMLFDAHLQSFNTRLSPGKKHFCLAVKFIEVSLFVLIHIAHKRLQSRYTYFNLFICHLIVHSAILRRLWRGNINFCFLALLLLLLLLLVVIITIASSHVYAVTLIIRTVNRSICRHCICKRVASGVGIATHVGVGVWFIIYIWLFHRVVLLHIFLCTLCVVEMGFVGTESIIFTRCREVFTRTLSVHIYIRWVGTKEKKIQIRRLQNKITRLITHRGHEQKISEMENEQQLHLRMATKSAPAREAQLFAPIFFHVFVSPLVPLNVFLLPCLASFCVLTHTKYLNNATKLYTEW